jgi:hypothetical protein
MDAIPDFSPSQLWNADETGISTVVDPGKVITSTGIKQVRKITSGERGSNVTAMCCMSAIGQYIPPFFVFPRKRMKESLMHGSLAGSVGYVNDRGTGYMDKVLFPKWIQHFSISSNSQGVLKKGPSS